MVLVPLLGWLKTNAAGHVLVLFDSVELPVLMEKTASCRPCSASCTR
jgi:cytochrome b561